MSADISRSELTTKLVNTTDTAIDKILATPAGTDISRQWDTSVLLVSNKVFNQRDSLINSLRYLYSRRLFETSYKLEYRAPYEQLYTVEPRIVFRYRKNDAGEILFRSIPGMRINFRSGKNLRFYMDMNLEIGSFSGKTNQENYRFGNYYFGYNWAF